MANSPVDVTVSQEGLRALVRAIRAEEDGKVLRRELAKSLRQALKPHADRAKSAALGIPSHGTSVGPALRPAIAKGIVPQADLTARRTGARIRVKKTPRIRGFSHAPKRTNSRKGWRTQSWGNDRWRVQVGKVHWFDSALTGVEGPAREAVSQAMEDMARRIANRTR